MTKRAVHTVFGSIERNLRNERRRKKSDARPLIDEVFGESLHKKRLDSLTNGTEGVLRAARLSIHAIGQAYAEFAQIKPKSGINQVDRFLNNRAIDVEALQAPWGMFVLGGRNELVIALDWTEFDDDDHTTLAAYVVTTHGRATPLAWKTYRKSELKGNQKGHEFAMVEHLHRIIPEDVRITLVADRGFGDKQFYSFLELHHWDYVIRFRGNIMVEHKGEAKPASDWLPPSGRATKLVGAKVTSEGAEVPAVVVVKRPKMKDAWHLATSLSAASATRIIRLYGRRFTIEETFRDQKDIRFGMGLRATHINDAGRRDRILLLAAIAHALLTLLGAAAEEAGLDRYLKANTVKHRTHSLFRQGSYWYGCIPTMREDWLIPLLEAFERIVTGHAVFEEVFAVI